MRAFRTPRSSWRRLRSRLPGTPRAGVGMADVFGFKIITQYERGIVFRWGRALPGIRQPGLNWVNPFSDRLRKVNMQIVVATVPAQATGQARPEAVGIEDAPPDSLKVPVPEVPALAVPPSLAAGPAQHAPLNGAPKTLATV